jgi:hypothetical protein
VLSFISKTFSIIGHIDSRSAATSIRLQRSGYGYGKESRFYRGSFQSHKRPFIPQPQINRFGPPQFGIRPIPFGYGVPPVPPGWNPLNPTIPQGWPQPNYAQNDWMPALPINPYQVPQQHMQWQAAQMSWGSIQQQQQVIQQPQAYNSWTPAMATNVTNTSSNQNNFLNNNNSNPKT